MKVLLQYFGQAKKADQQIQRPQSLQETIKDNLKRVIQFLISRQMLVTAEQEQYLGDQEHMKQRIELYKKSKEIIGPFWTEW